MNRLCEQPNKCCVIHKKTFHAVLGGGSGNLKHQLPIWNTVILPTPCTIHPFDTDLLPPCASSNMHTNQHERIDHPWSHQTAPTPSAKPLFVSPWLLHTIHTDTHVNNIHTQSGSETYRIRSRAIHTRTDRWKREQLVPIINRIGHCQNLRRRVDNRFSCKRLFCKVKCELERIQTTNWSWTVWTCVQVFLSVLYVPVLTQ